MYSEIVPKHLQEELIQIGEDITKKTFRAGDIVIAVMEFVAINGLGYSKSDVWRAVGSYIGKGSARYSIRNLFVGSMRYYQILISGKL